MEDTRKLVRSIYAITAKLKKLQRVERPHFEPVYFRSGSIG